MLMILDERIKKEGKGDMPDMKHEYENMWLREKLMIVLAQHRRLMQ